MKRKVLLGLIGMNLLMGLVFLISILNLRRGVSMLGTGLGLAENYLFMSICVIGMIKMTYEIIKH